MKFLFLTILMLASSTALHATDVIVYGSTPGGFCAAIAAAREGASVILLEPTQHVGGLSTGGLSHCDSNQMRRETLMGLFDEWHTRIVKDYTDRGLPAPYDAARKDTAKWTFEPHVAMRVTMAMLKQAGVTVKTGRYLKSVTKDGPRITSIVTKDGTFQAKVFVDGSYEGDLMAAAGVDWTIGREGRAEFGESYAGKQYPKKKMDISGFDDEGNLLPLVTTSDAGPDDTGDKNIMTYSFRLCLTRDPAKMVSMPAPANYNPARFELARRALKVGAQVGFDLYPLPGGKIDGNNSIGGQISLGLVGGCNTWHNADEAGRAKIWEDHKQYTLEFLHFLRNDPAVPPKKRDEYAKLGFCKDEFAEIGHFPPALYVRESRRMKGLHVISQKDIIDSPEKDDPIAISSFPIDSHDCQRVALKGGGVINEGTIFPVRLTNSNVGYAYHVPYRAVLPQAAQCNNLLVPVALSCTHVAISSLRIEGAWMAIGQGAGIAAALSAKLNTAVQDLPYPVLKERLLAQGQVLTLPVAKPAGLTKGPNATVLRDGKPYRGIGINYFDCFLRTLIDGDDTSYDAGFATLAAKGIPFVRFSATGYWPSDMKLYQTDRAEYFRRLDAVVKSAEKHGIGLVPSLFWAFACVPDLVGEPMDQWGNPQSKTHAWMRQYVREIVTRYHDHLAIWAWEFGNEYSLSASLPNAKDCRAPIQISLGTPETRSERDDLTFAMVRVAFAEFGKAVREHDTKRLILTGDSFPRLSAWHQEHENTWTHDTAEQFAETLTLANPDPISAISLHAYEDDNQRFAAAMEVSRKLDKPIFIGEFGAPGETPEQAEKCRRLLKAIVDHDIPLAALWVFDLKSQKEFNVTADNARAWQLDLLSEVNKNRLTSATFSQ